MFYFCKVNYWSSGTETGFSPGKTPLDLNLDSDLGLAEIFSKTFSDPDLANLKKNCWCKRSGRLTSRVCKGQNGRQVEISSAGENKIAIIGRQCKEELEGAIWDGWCGTEKILRREGRHKKNSAERSARTFVIHARNRHA